MKRVFILSLNTFRESMREKFFWVAVALALLLFVISLALGLLSFAEEQKIMTDFGLMAIELSLLFVTAFSGAYVISKELEKQTCLLLLSRPLSRSQFLMGKVLGLVWLSGLLFFCGSVVLWMLIRTSSGLENFILISMSIYLKTLVVLAFTVCVSLVVQPFVSLVCGVGIYLVGHWLDDMTYFAMRSKSEFYGTLSEVFSYTVPQFHRFNWKSFVFLERGIPTDVYLSMVLHYGAWILVCFFFCDWLFRKKDFV